MYNQITKSQSQISIEENITVNHILVSKSEKIVYLSCKDEQGKIKLYCIYDNQLVKTCNRGDWQILNQIISRKILNLAEKFIYKSPTYDVYNIVSQFVN